MSLIMIVAVGALMYVMMIRPAQKRMREQQQMQASLQPGDRVLLAAGIIGTLKHLGDRQAVLELAPGTDITVVKGAIASVLGPDDEEFEYADDLEDLPAATPVAPASAAGSTVGGATAVDPTSTGEPRPGSAAGVEPAATPHREA